MTISDETIELWDASQRGDAYFIEDLLEGEDRECVDVNAQNEYGESALILAVSFGKPEAVKVLLEHNADIEARTIRGQTPLMLSACDEDKELIHHLVEAGASVNAQDNDGETVLHYAGRRGNPEIVQYLLDKGADASIVNRKGETAENQTAVPTKGEAKSILVAHRERLELRQVAGIDDQEPVQRSRRL